MAGRLEISLVRDDREARDTWIVDILTSNQESSELFRSIVLEIQRDPKWADTQKDTDDLIKRIEFEIRSAAKYVQFQEKHGNDLR